MHCDKKDRLESIRGNVLAGDGGVKLKITILWDVTLSRLVDRHHCLEELCCLHLQDKKYPPKCLQISTKRHGVTPQNTCIQDRCLFLAVC